MFVVVELILVYVVIRYRARPGQVGRPKPVYGHTVLEIGWTLAPAAILVFIAVPTIQTIFQVDGTPPPDALEVEVIGHQWWWEYHYPEYGFRTATELHVPVGRPVLLTITSQDVIHSFWAPKLGGKRDAMPGRTTRLVFTADSLGRFLGQCAEFCGASHANMRLAVIVDDEATFAEWAARQQQGPAAIDAAATVVQEGAAVFQRVREPANHSCIACHAVGGVAYGALGPDLTHLADRAVIAGGILPNTEEGLTRWLRDPVTEKPGSLMPRVDLTDEEIAALVAYLRSLR